MNKKYNATTAKADFPNLEQSVLKMWSDRGTFKKTLKQTENGQPFSFYDGPPFANNTPHLGHLSVSAMKDMVARFQTMNGKHVVRELGWDCHGLPAELSVEKQFKKPALDYVRENGIADFCEKCSLDVTKYAGMWVEYIDRLGRWVDTDNGTGYRTMDKNFMESVIWTIKELYKKDLIFQDVRINPLSWKLGTVLSNFEANQDYRDVTDDAITVALDLSNGMRALVWTTTPWTLPANSALAVNPNLNYAVYHDVDGNDYVLVETRVKAYEKQLVNATFVKTIPGSELVGLTYTPLFPYYLDHEKRDHLFTILGGDFVTDSDGTGIVHIAPAFGEDDFQIARNHNAAFPVICNVDDNGNFTADVLDWANKNIFESQPEIMSKLREMGRLVKKESYTHSYPYCARAGEKLIYKATNSFYVDVPKIREQLIANNKKVNWITGGGRFEKWIEGARAWSISRNRYFGVPIPVWVSDNPQYPRMDVYGSIAEIENDFDVKLNDLHRPSLDPLTRPNPDDPTGSSTMRRVTDVLDCWFESGSMPWASLHYPFENVDRFEKTFPADYIIEGMDQTRGWFYTLMVLATALFDKPAFMTVTANGLTLDENKKKMSKSLGNYSDPSEMFKKYGADSIRLYVLGSPLFKGEPISIDKAGSVFAKTLQSTLIPLWNAYHLFTLYANADNVVANENYNSSDVLDRYILNKMNDLINDVTSSLSAYSTDTAVRQITTFIDVLNNWYIRRSRERFWNGDQSAFDTLYTVLITLCKLMAPLTPFITESIYTNLTGLESVHLCKWPVANKMSEFDHKLVMDMDRVQMISATAKALREQFGLRNRLPLSSMTVAGWNAPEYTEILADELNVKNVIFTETYETVADPFLYLITPKIGARLGAHLSKIIPASKSGDYKLVGDKLEIAGQTLNSDEFEIRLNVKPNVSGATLPDNTAVVILDTFVTPELAAEGMARDTIRFIQDTRKEMNLNVSDRISIVYETDDELSNAINTHLDMISENVLATAISAGKSDAFTTEIEGHKLSISITKN